MKSERLPVIAVNAMSLPSREAWIEISCVSPALTRAASLPSREAWIEIPYKIDKELSASVASLAGSVD